MRSFFKIVTSNERGSQLIEQCFVFPVFLLLIIGFFDVSRFLTTETLLTKGAYDAAMLASRLPNVDTDISELPSNSNAYKRFQIARNMIIAEARKLPIATIVGEAGSVDPVRLMKFRMTDTILSPETKGFKNTQGYDAALIRPTECARVDAPGDTNDVKCVTECLDNDKNCFKHPVVPPQSDDGSSYNTNQKNLMENELMMVVLKSEVEMMIPGLGNMQAQGIGIARRQALPFSPFERVVEDAEGIVDVDYAVEEPLAAPGDGPEPEARVRCVNEIVKECSSRYPGRSGKLGSDCIQCPSEEINFFTASQF